MGLYQVYPIFILKIYNLLLYPLSVLEFFSRKIHTMFPMLVLLFLVILMYF